MRASTQTPDRDGRQTKSPLSGRLAENSPSTFGTRPRLATAERGVYVICVREKRKAAPLLRDQGSASGTRRSSPCWRLIAPLA